MILYTDTLYRWIDKTGVLRIFGAAKEEGEKEEPGLSGHVIVVGMNALGSSLVDSLHERGERVLAIDTDTSKLEGLPCETMLGNAVYKSVLDAANLKRAKLLISTLHIEDTNRLLAYRGRIASVPTAIHAFDRSIVEALEKQDVARLIEPRRDGVEREWRALRKHLLPDDEEAEW